MSTTLSTKDLLAQIEKLQAENAKIKADNKPKQRAMSLKIGQKGTVCVYGLGRFPVALYPGQWERLLKFMPEIAEFIKANAQAIAEVQEAAKATQQ